MHPHFTKKLLKWNREENNRQMPWKGQKDPYKIWLSEIILQQTRVEQGLDYYNKFIENFPTVQKLATAPENTVFKLWEGLGYYTRCKNLIATAKFIANNLNGKFPNQYEDILALKGIGPYTAAAIASFAFNLPFAVMDGNVFRVLSRYFGISTPIDSTAGKKLYQLLANELLDKNEPGIYNQAIMDFGAVVCKPRQPLCKSCPQKKDCLAFQHNTVQVLPVKEKQLVRRSRFLLYFLVFVNDKLLVRRRTAGDIWENLYEFVLHESDVELETSKTGLQPVLKQIFGRQATSIHYVSPAFSQQLTHQNIVGRFVEIQLHKVPDTLSDYTLVSKKELQQLPFPKLITAYLQQQSKPMQLF